MSDTLNIDDTSEDVGDANLIKKTWRRFFAPSSSTPIIARMPVNPDAYFYNMNHPKRGIAVIFNHETFIMKNLSPRSGTNKDRDDLSTCLKDLGFIVKIYENVSYNTLIRKVKKVASMDHTDNDCVLIAILSHGDMGIIYANDTSYKLENVWSHFTGDLCPSLAGKPKLFFVQACQGDKLDRGVTLSRVEVDGVSTQNAHSYQIPTHADILIAYSTVPGFYAWRNLTQGSWFIQSLCEVLKVYGKQVDLMTVLTLVLRRVAVDYESNVPDTPTMHKQKQIPCFTSMLSRLLIFKEKLN